MMPIPFWSSVASQEVLQLAQHDLFVLFSCKASVKQTVLITELDFQHVSKIKLTDKKENFMFESNRKLYFINFKALRMCTFS